jgi:hypothetical protein
MRAALRIAALMCLPFAAQAQVQGVMLDDAVSMPDFSFHDERGGGLYQRRSEGELDNRDDWFSDLP